MATIHFEEIQQILKDKGAKDAFPWVSNGEGYFVEIKFNDDKDRPSVIDEEFKNLVLSANTPYGQATIIFDEFGQLFSINIRCVSQ